MRIAVAASPLYLGCALVMSLESPTGGTLQERTLEVEWWVDSRKPSVYSP